MLNSLAFSEGVEGPKVPRWLIHLTRPCVIPCAQVFPRFDPNTQLNPVTVIKGVGWPLWGFPPTLRCPIVFWFKRSLRRETNLTTMFWNILQRAMESKNANVVRNVSLPPNRNQKWFHRLCGHEAGEPTRWSTPSEQPNRQNVQVVSVDTTKTNVCV